METYLTNSQIKSFNSSDYSPSVLTKKGPISFQKNTDMNISVEPIQSTDELN